MPKIRQRVGKKINVLMKRVLFTFCTFICAMLFTSCENSKIKISPSYVTLHCEEEVGLTAIDNHSDVRWVSDDDFVASVNSNGIVTAEHVGRTTITAKDGKDEAYCSVSVTPEYYTYNEPILDWGCSKQTIISKKGTPDDNQTDGLVYVQSESKGIIEMYMFENGKLYGCGVALKLSYANTDVANFLLERYQVVGVNNGIYYFINAMTLETATLGVSLMIDDYVLVTYAPWDGSSNNMPARCPSKKSYDYHELANHFHDLLLDK